MSLTRIINQVIGALLLLLIISFVFVLAFSLASLIIAAIILGVVGWGLYCAGIAIRRWWRRRRWPKALWDMPPRTKP